ncbi:hypothetical protein ABIB83_008092 [Bradyrhizobium sp. I1.8.5]|uniref:hypothetical protein n=1 Tax=Bradyrhizobium sp. I1.8.5 TaxID=3156365 RepID=UPI0033995448
MAHPGIVLRRAVGSSSSFKEHGELPSAASLDARPHKEKAKAKRATSAKPSKRNENSEREAAAKCKRPNPRQILLIFFPELYPWDREALQEASDVADRRQSRTEGDDDGAGFSHLPF